MPAITPASATVSWVSDDDYGFNPATPAQLWRADQASGPWVAQGAAASASAVVSGPKRACSVARATPKQVEVIKT